MVRGIIEKMNCSDDVDTLLFREFPISQPLPKAPVSPLSQQFLVKVTHLMSELLLNLSSYILLYYNLSVQSLGLDCLTIHWWYYGLHILLLSSKRYLDRAAPDFADVVYIQISSSWWRWQGRVWHCLLRSRSWLTSMAMILCVALNTSWSCIILWLALSVGKSMCSILTALWLFDIFLEVCTIIMRKQ